MTPSRVTVLLALAAAPAFASSTFPAAIRAHLSLPAPIPQDCALCHVNGITGAGTVNTLFGKAVRARGAVANNETALNTAIDRMATDAVDSDGDGVTDIQELRNGTDPNVADRDGGTGGGAGGGAGGGGGTVTLPPPSYGCGASTAPGLLGAVGLLGLAALRRVRRRR